MEQRIITFTQTFKALNGICNNPLFNFNGDKIRPLDNRIKLLFIDSLPWLDYSPPYKFSSSQLSKVPKEELIDAIESSFKQHLTEGFVFIYCDPPITSEKQLTDFAIRFDNTTICIQQEKTTGIQEKLWKRYLVSTEELGKLISMLYFREKGYIVQSPLRTYGKEGDNRPGVDDVAAWKSPVIDELRKFGFIDKGCHISELACLRWLGKSSTSDKALGDLATGEILLTEVEPSKQRGISSSGSTGISQLLRAQKEKVANKLFICFPFISENAEQIFAEIRNKAKPATGAILFDNKGIYIQDSEVFPHENMHSAIGEYEKKLKKVLLNNFYFEEILSMIKELGLDTRNKGFQEVLIDFYSKIEEIPVSYLLEQLNRLVK